MAIGDRYGAGEPPAGFGTYPSGPLVAVPTMGNLRVGRAVPVAAAARAGSRMPSAAAVDYAHKLTSTTVLLVGLGGFLWLGADTLRVKARPVRRPHVGS